jgi:hypothetical protein
MIGGPIFGGPIIGGPIGAPGGTVLFGARPTSSASSDEIIRIDCERDPCVATTKDGSTFPIIKIEKISDTECKVFGPSGRTSIIKTKVYADDILFENKKYKPDDEEHDIGLIEIIKKTAPATLTSSTSTTTTTPTAMTFGPTAVLTPSKQIIPIAPVNPVASNLAAVGTDGKPITGVPVPFGRGIVGMPGARPSGIIGMRGGPGVVVGGPMMMGTPVRFGRGVF